MAKDLSKTSACIGFPFVIRSDRVASPITGRSISIMTSEVSKCCKMVIKEIKDQFQMLRNKYRTTMGSRGLLLLAPATSSNRLLLSRFSKLGFWEALGQKEKKIGHGVHNCRVQSSLEPPNVPRLAETARISLTPDEAEEFAPKIQQVVDWFGQLQSVDLHSIKPAIRADTEVVNFREDSPEVFENREAMIAAIPSFEESFINVPKVLNKD